MSFLRPCPECHRHALSEEVSCPFCSADLPPAGPPPRLPGRRIGRAALMAFGAMVAVGAAGCDQPGDPQDAGMDAGMIVAVDAAYGAPPDTGPPPGFDAGPDAEIVAVDAAYGAPPFDGGP